MAWKSEMRWIFLYLIIPLSLLAKDSQHGLVSVDYLYWKAYAHIPYALKYDLVNLSENIVSHDQVNIQSVDFKYHPGFRIKVGAYLPEKSWTTSVEYTRYYSQQDSSVQGNDYVGPTNNRLVGIWNSARINGENPMVFVDFHAKQRIHYSVLTALLFKSHLFSNFSLSPYIGLQGAWIKVSDSILYKGFASTFFPFIKVNLLNRLRGIGIKGGIKGTWILPFGFGIFGNIALSEIWGRLHLNQQESQIYDSNSNVSSTTIETRSMNRFNKLGTIQSTFQFVLGINWDTKLKKDRYLLRLQSSYEVNLWPDFIELRKYLIQKTALNSPDENHIHYYKDYLAFQGLVLRIFFAL